MEYQATAKYLRVSTRKVRLVADSIRSMNPEQAIVFLSEAPKHAGSVLVKTVSSALASAKQKSADVHALRFKTIEVMGGPVMKRWRSVSRGQAHGYKKRMTHVRVILTDETKESDKSDK